MLHSHPTAAGGETPDHRIPPAPAAAETPNRAGEASLPAAGEGGTAGMPIRPLLAQSAFDPETIEMLVSAFDAAWDKVEKSGSRLALPRYARGAREIVAKQIIELAQNGERNLQRLADDAVAHLTQFYE